MNHLKCLDEVNESLNSYIEHEKYSYWTILFRRIKRIIKVKWWVYIKRKNSKDINEMSCGVSDKEPSYNKYVDIMNRLGWHKKFNDGTNNKIVNDENEYEKYPIDGVRFKW